jgi:hypothetical protein
LVALPVLFVIFSHVILQLLSSLPQMYRRLLRDDYIHTAPSPVLRQENQKIFGIWDKYYTSYGIMTCRCSECGLAHGPSSSNRRSLLRDMLNTTFWRDTHRERPRKSRALGSSDVSEKYSARYHRPQHADHSHYSHTENHRPVGVPIVDQREGMKPTRQLVDSNRDDEATVAGKRKVRRIQHHKEYEQRRYHHRQQQNSNREDPRNDKKHPSSIHNSNRHSTVNENTRGDINPHSPVLSSSFRRKPSHPLVGYFMRWNQPRARRDRGHHQQYQRPHRWADPNPDVCEDDTGSSDMSVLSSNDSNYDSDSSSSSSSSSSKGSSWSNFTPSRPRYYSVLIWLLNHP